MPKLTQHNRKDTTPSKNPSHKKKLQIQNNLNRKTDVRTKETTLSTPINIC